jgi:hypothetical protein
MCVGVRRFVRLDEWWTEYNNITNQNKKFKYRCYIYYIHCFILGIDEWGLFAVEDINKDEVVIEYVGMCI